MIQKRKTTMTYREPKTIVCGNQDLGLNQRTLGKFAILNIRYKLKTEPQYKSNR